MKTKIIASLVVLGLAFSVLMFMFVTGCGVTSGGGTVSNPRLYVSDYTNGSVIIINPSTLTIVGSIELPGATTPKWMAIHPNGKKVYVADEGAYALYIVNTNTNNVTSLEVCTGPRGMAFNSDGTKLFVAQSSWDVSIVDATNDTFNDDPGVTTIYGFGDNNNGICFNPTFGEKIYVVSRDISSANAKVYISSAEAGSTPTFEAVPYSYDVVTGPSGHSVYVSTHDGGTYKIISLEASTLTLSASFDVSSNGARNIALSPDGNYIYATICDYSYIDYLNLNNGSVGAINVVSGGPLSNYNLEQLTFSPDGSKLFAVNNGVSPNQVVVIDTASKTWTGVATMPAGADCFGIVYKP